MKIAICGKGGSGKSTISALLAVTFSKSGYKVLVVDSDESNSGLYRKLGFSNAPLPIIELAGGRKGIKSRNEKLIIGGKNPKADLLELSSVRIDEIPDENIVRKNGISFIQVGKINEALEGCACPMGVINREFLGKLELRDNEVAIVDTEAGLEHFGRGVDTNIDTIVILVDPSSESVDFAQKAYLLSKSININNILVILNKVNSPLTGQKMLDKLKEKNITPVISVPIDEVVFDAEMEGREINSKNAKNEIQKLVKLIIDNRGN